MLPNVLTSHCLLFREFQHNMNWTSTMHQCKHSATLQTCTQFKPHLPAVLTTRTAASLTTTSHIYTYTGPLWQLASFHTTGTRQILCCFLGVPVPGGQGTKKLVMRPQIMTKKKLWTNYSCTRNLKSDLMLNKLFCSAYSSTDFTVSLCFDKLS